MPLEGDSVEKPLSALIAQPRTAKCIAHFLKSWWILAHNCSEMNLKFVLYWPPRSLPNIKASIHIHLDYATLNRAKPHKTSVCFVESNHFVDL